MDAVAPVMSVAPWYHWYTFVPVQLVSDDPPPSSWRVVPGQMSGVPVAVATALEVHTVVSLQAVHGTATDIGKSKVRGKPALVPSRVS